jgi:murein DD-endopeptidase MepM/ murein hydrolase activator NlpD
VVIWEPNVVLKLDPNSLPDDYEGSDRFGDDVYAVYGHLSRSSVRKGQLIKEGQRIGITGYSGDAERTTPHLHFELRAIPDPGGYSGLLARIDPADFFSDELFDDLLEGGPGRLVYPTRTPAPSQPFQQVKTQQ